MKKVLFICIVLFNSVISYAQIPSYVSPANLLGWYPFNGNANNAFGTGRNGSVMGAALTTDRFGIANSAYHFNGSTDHIVIDTTFFNVGWSDFTVSCWLNSDTMDNPFNAIHSGIMVNTIPHNGFALAFNWNSTHQYSVWANQTPGIATWSIIFDGTAVTPVAIHSWKHLVMVKKNGNDYNFYINGVFDSHITASVLASTYYCKLVFGRDDSSASNETFYGKLDDYGIWNRALTPCEIWALYMGTTATPAGVITGPDSVCTGSTIALGDTATGGTWTSSNAHATVSTTGLVTGVSAGIDTISYTVTLPCGPVSATKIITVNPTPTSITGSMILCVGAATTLNSTPAGGTWTSGSTPIATVGSGTGIVTGLSAGTANITYTTTGGCSVFATVTVSLLGSGGVIGGPSSVCTGSTISLTETVTGGAWGASNTNATVSTSGVVTGASVGVDTISYAVTLSCGSAIATKVITVNQTPTVITGTMTVCVSATTTLNSTPAGGVWSSGSALTAGVGTNSGIVTGVSAGSAGITYTAADGCKVFTTVTVNPLPVAGSIGGPSSVCVGFTIPLTETMTGGTWSSSNSHATVSISGVVSGVSTGTDTIKYSVTNSCGTATAIKIISVGTGLPDAGTIGGPDSICAGASVTLTDTAAGGKWNSSAAAVATIDSVSGRLVGIATGAVTITYTVKNGCGTNRTYKIITINPLPPAGTITGMRQLCASGSLTLSNAVTGGTWSTSNLAVATIGSLTGQLTALSPGITTITYTTAPTAYGCVNKTSITFTVLSVAPFVMTYTHVDVRCNGDTDGSVAVSITGGSGNYTYVWSTGSTVASVSDLMAGTYTVHVKDGSSRCAADYVFNINEPDTIGVTAVIQNDFCKAGTGSISISVKGGTEPYTCNWPDNRTGTELQNLLSGTYMVTITDSNGCMKTDSFTVQDDTCKEVVIHDVITPNGDGINDVWVIEALTKYPNNGVQVFDKWGDMVFDKRGYNNDWYGKGNKGELLPDGTYYYVVKLNANNAAGGNNLFTGTILIKR